MGPAWADLSPSQIVDTRAARRPAIPKDGDSRAFIRPVLIRPVGVTIRPKKARLRKGAKGSRVSTRPRARILLMRG